MSTSPHQRFYRLRGPEWWGGLTEPFVGGFGRNDVANDAGDLLQIERAGPFVPPIAVIAFGHVIVTEEFRRVLDAWEPGHSWAPVEVVKAVDLPWHTWDRQDEYPQIFPEEEVDTYFDPYPHSPEVARLLPPLFRLIFPIGIYAEFRRRSPHLRKWDDYVDPKTWNGRHFFGIPFPHDIFPGVTTEAKVWLESNFPEWVTFEEFKVL